MPDVSKCEEITVAATTSHIVEDIVPNGKTWAVSNVGGSSRETGDGKSCNIGLRFDGVLQRKFNMEGSSVNLPVQKELAGDGVKTMKIVLRNNSATSVKMIYWIDRHERES